MVSFAPGARTAWHTHPVGQSLHVVSGVGRVQLKGGPVQEIHPGDSVWIEPGEGPDEAALHERGMADDELISDDERGRFAGTSAVAAEPERAEEFQEGPGAEEREGPRRRVCSGRRGRLGRRACLRRLCGDLR